jgi:hypothetical protein
MIAYHLYAIAAEQGTFCRRDQATERVLNLFFGRVSSLGSVAACVAGSHFQLRDGSGG